MNSQPQLTARALLTGIVLGVLLTPCNIYSGLKIGWSFNMSITAALVSFAFWRLLEPVPGVRPLGMLENNINQTTASSSASIISSGLVAPIPALTMLTGRELSFPVLAAWVLAVSLVGVALAVGLRRQMMSDTRLRFPVGIATAETLRDIYGHTAETMAKVRVLLGAGVTAAVVRGIQESALALPRLAPALSIPAAGSLKTAGVSQISMRNLGFAFDPSLLMIGFGAIIGLRPGISLLAGAVFAWGVLAPWALARGWASPGTAGSDSIWFGQLVEWLLWPGVALMVTASLASFVILVVKRRRDNNGPGWRARLSGAGFSRWFVIGVAAAGLFAVAAQAAIFGIRIPVAIIAVIFSLVLAVVAARVVGETGIPPIGAMGKVTQLGFGAISPGNVTDNLMSANVTGGAAGQCADLLNDLKTGSEIGASPSRQAIAQVFGVVTGSLAGSAAYLILIPDPAGMLITREWPAPAVATWKAVAEVLQAGVSSLTPDLVIAMGIAGAAGLALSLAEHFLPRRYARRLPSAPAFGLAFVIPAWTSIALFLGALLAASLRRYTAFWTEQRVLAGAAGLVAGESLLGVTAAMVRFGQFG